MPSDWLTWLGVGVVAAIAGLGGGFVWGIADQRGPAAVSDFADRHIYFPNNEKEMMLVFRCDRDSTLIAYDLLHDDILQNERSIRARLSAGPNKIFSSDLFSHSTAFAGEGMAVFFSFKDQLQAWKRGRKSGGALLLVSAVLIPTGYLGYQAAKWFNLECGTKLIYQRLAKPLFWAPFRLTAARVLFQEVEHCIDRNTTLNRTAPQLHDLSKPLAGNGRSPEGAEQIDVEADVARWRDYIKNVNEEVPNTKRIVERFRSYSFRPNNDWNKYPPTWGDSIFQRLYGTGDELMITPDRIDFDRDDFTAMAAIRQKCRTLNQTEALLRYHKIVTKDQKLSDDFFDKRNYLIRAVTATMAND
jgi:hypothetical protein